MHDKRLLSTEEKVGVFVEYGAGRAGLSSFIADHLSTLLSEEKIKAEHSKFVIVDRDTRRFKLDKNFKDTFETFREKMDIADFNL